MASQLVRLLYAALALVTLVPQAGGVRVEEYAGNRSSNDIRLLLDKNLGTEKPCLNEIRNREVMDEIKIL